MADPPPRMGFIIGLACLTVVLIAVMWLARPQRLPHWEDALSESLDPPTIGPQTPSQPAPRESESRQISVSRSSYKELNQQDSRSATQPHRADPLMALADRWGIAVSSVRLSAGGHALDIRYWVVDPAKARCLPGLRERLYLVDQTTGKQVAIPGLPKRQASRMTVGKTHFLLAANTGRFVKPGNKVALVVGNAQAPDLTVE